MERREDVFKFKRLGATATTVVQGGRLPGTTEEAERRGLAERGISKGVEASPRRAEANKARQESAVCSVSFAPTRETFAPRSQRGFDTALRVPARWGRVRAA